MTDPARPDVVDALADGDAAAWVALLEHLAAHQPPVAPPPVVRAWLARDPSPDAWVQRAKRAAVTAESPWFSTARGALRAFLPWWTAGVAAALPPDDPVALESRLQALGRDVEEGAAGRVAALIADLRRPPTAARLLPRALLLAARRAREARAWDDALAAATEARALAAEPELVDASTRAHAAALLGLRRVGEALSLLDRALARRGPLFGGGGAFSLTPSADPVEDAIDEAATVAGWADATTPEWVRALGGLSERLGSPDAAARFAAGLAALSAGSDPVVGLEVVLRQAAERGLAATARAAAQALAAHRALAPEEALRLAHLEADAIVDPAARAEALLVAARAADPGALCDTDAGHALADVAVDALVAGGDLRAVEVARAVLDAKRARYGDDAPATWQELGNVGIAWARLGRSEDARDCLERAVAGLGEALGPDHPATARARRNLARVRTGS
jgi:tetratricopeptide (TPR) repeat protein